MSRWLESGRVDFKGMEMVMLLSRICNGVKDFRKMVAWGTGSGIFSGWKMTRQTFLGTYIAFSNIAKFYKSLNCASYIEPSIMIKTLVPPPFPLTLSVIKICTIITKMKIE